MSSEADKLHKEKLAPCTRTHFAFVFVGKRKGRTQNPKFSASKRLCAMMLKLATYEGSLFTNPQPFNGSAKVTVLCRADSLC